MPSDNGLYESLETAEGHVRIMVLNQSPKNPGADERHDRVQSLLRSYTSAGTELDLCYPDDFEGARVLLDKRARGVPRLALATTARVAKTVWAEQNGYDAVVQGNTFEPGVEAARLAVRIPVIGLIRITLHAAASLSDRIGVTVPTGHGTYTRRAIRAYGLEHFVTDVREVDVYGDDIDSRGEEIFTETVAAIKTLVHDTRAECIVPLGGALIPNVVSPLDIEQAVGVPVLNSKAIGIRFAETCVALRMSHSPISYPGAELNHEDFFGYAYSKPAGVTPA